MRAFSVKNGRFSSKYDSASERFTTAGSTSTCPKSGLIVASTVLAGAVPSSAGSMRPIV